MTIYLSPGVYVEEAPPSARPIAGVGTSTAGFVGVVPDKIETPNAVVVNESIGTGDGAKTDFPLDRYPVQTNSGFQMRVNGAVAVATLANDDLNRVSTVKFAVAPANGSVIVGDYRAQFLVTAKAGEPVLCANFGEFTRAFGDFSINADQRVLAQAVFGFFHNGGTRCYVTRSADASKLTDAVASLSTIDEIAILAAPGITAQAVQEAIIDQCESLQDRFAILDGAQNPSSFTKDKIQSATKDSGFAAIYFPWVKVVDPVERTLNPAGAGTSFVPPSGHLAGAFAAVDATRGVHKAPANIPLRGVLDVQHRLTNSHQDGLNPKGVNLIRSFNGNIKVWGARTMGGDDNGEFRYVSTRRFFNFLRESIEEGTQFAVFEPNNPALWQRIMRSVGDFLLGQWRAGALFGETPKQAFFVKCDAETNPPDVRERGQVVTEIGVAIVKPAEFVVFRIQQTTGN